MKIADIRATTVTVPLEAPLRHANGAHWGRFVRTIVEVETDDGLIGLGEMGGGGESAEAAFRGLKPYLVGHDPFALEEMRFLIAQPDGVLYNNRTQLLAALEFACLDILGQKLGRAGLAISSAAQLRDAVDLRDLSLLPLPESRNRRGRGAHGRAARRARARAEERHTASRSHKLKGGVFPPDYELECYRALAAALPGRRLPLRPERASGRVEQAIRFGQAIEDLRNDYLEDPVFGLNGMRRVAREWCGCRSRPTPSSSTSSSSPPTSSTRRSTSILLDTTFWGGIRPCVKAAGVCETFQLGVAVHSSGELGIQLATMLHLGAVLPNLSFAADAHYHHLTDDVIEGGLMRYENGAIAVPDGPGLGVKLDRDKLAQYQRALPGAGRLSLRPGSRAVPTGRRSCRTTAGPTRRLRRLQNCLSATACTCCWRALPAMWGSGPATNILECARDARVAKWQTRQP